MDSSGCDCIRELKLQSLTCTSVVSILKYFHIVISFFIFEIKEEHTSLHDWEIVERCTGLVINALFVSLYNFLIIIVLPCSKEVTKASLIAQLVKNPPTRQETQVQFLGWEDPLEKETATHSSVLAWRIPWTVACQAPLSMGLQESDTT